MSNAAHFEKTCRPYAFGASVTYARSLEKEGNVYCGPLFTSVSDLVEAKNNDEVLKRVNKRNIRTFDVRKYEVLRLYDHQRGQVTVLLDEETYAIIS